MNWEVPIMRSKTLSSDLTILKKDVTRFAPVWLALCAYLIVWGVSVLPERSGGPWYSNYYEPIAPIFAPILALCVFGYLCDPIECNAVHSLPIRRGRLFGIHVLSATLMFLLPTALFSFLTRNWIGQVAWYRFIVTGTEFLLLFSIGTLCMMLTGRKVGAALLFLFIQLFTTILGAVAESIYLPLLPGLFMGTDYILSGPLTLVSRHAVFIENSPISVNDWIFLAVVLLISLVILAASLMLYRRRRLERAGDLLAVQWLDPFFAVCSAVTGTSAMIVFGFESEWGMFFGCVIGYLSYWMLSMKTARVFTPKVLGGFVCLLGVLIGSIYLVHLDPLDRVYFVPEPEDVAAVTLGQGQYASESFTTSDPSGIAEIGRLHMELAEHNITTDPGDPYVGPIRRIQITYELKNGRTIDRQYVCDDEALLARAGWYLSQPEAIFRRSEPDFVSMHVGYLSSDAQYDLRLKSELEAAVLEDCRQGRMFDFDYSNSCWTIAFEQREPEWHTYLNIPETAVNTIAWLEEHCQIIP